MMYVIMYLAAIVAANLMVVKFGAGVTIINAFLFIGLDLTARDALHDKWDGKHLWRNMAMLIAAGSLISYGLNKDAGRIALASFLAFSAAGIVDTIAYHLLKNKPRLYRMNGSNIPAAAVDSIVFPLIAFGWPPMLGIMLGQFLAKTFGGAVWSIIIDKFGGGHENGRF